MYLPKVTEHVWMSICKIKIRKCTKHSIIGCDSFSKNLLCMSDLSKMKESMGGFPRKKQASFTFICVWFIPKFFWPKIYCVFSLGKNWPPNCFVRRSIQTTWAVLLLTVLLLYQRTRGSSRVAVTWHGFPFWTVYFLIAACLEHFWRQFFQTWKIAFRPTTFPRIAPAAPVGKNRWGWQDASALIL